MLAMILFLNCTKTTAQAPAAPAPQASNPSTAEVQQLTLILQITAVRCGDKTKERAKQVFDAVRAFRLKENRFPQSVDDLKDHSLSPGKASIPPANPFADPTLVSKELRQELINSGHEPSPLCKIIIESDPYVSAGFPLTLHHVKLKPDNLEPGTIVVKYNADYYLAVWCSGFTGKPIEDEKTHLPFLLFEDFSNLSH